MLEKEKGGLDCMKGTLDSKKDLPSFPFDSTKFLGSWWPLSPFNRPISA